MNRGNMQLTIKLLAGVAVMASGCMAAVLDVTLNTASLSGTQTIAFSLTNGDGVTNNTVILQGFNFGGGAALGTPTYMGTGISGNLTSGITMTDKDFLELFSQQFKVGSALSFTLTSTNAFAGGSPDGFLMYLCDATFTTCYSDDPVTGALLSLQLTGKPLTNADLVLTGAAAQGLAAPAVTAIPEPRFSLMIAIAGAGLALLRRKKPTPLPQSSGAQPC
jgi:hypothetical protein